MAPQRERGREGERAYQPINLTLSLSLGGIIRISIHFRLLVCPIARRKEGRKDEELGRGDKGPLPPRLLARAHLQGGKEVRSLARAEPKFYLRQEVYYAYWSVGRSVGRSRSSASSPK